MRIGAPEGAPLRYEPRDAGSAHLTVRLFNEGLRGKRLRGHTYPRSQGFFDALRDCADILALSAAN
jgi:hypothetical protein